MNRAVMPAEETCCCIILIPLELTRIDEQRATDIARSPNAHENPEKN
ncbi:hypothetical protein SAMN05216420_1012 [Nitrosospira sp. Nl5]|nr:hypothetical protein SAMN05216420_1012 [Nitrosospira sp. Nl5]